jgi:Bacterial regulatory proteins, crp family
MTFTSAVLGAVQHPTNILTEYLSRFRGVKKFKAYILSWLDGWIHNKLKAGKPPWVYVINQELAEALGCCRDTVFRHLKDLCEMGILRKTPYKRWATDNIWAYSIDFDRLKQELAPPVDISTAESQTADSRKSDSRLSGFVQPTVGFQTPYISPIPNSSQVQPQHSLPAAGEKVNQENISIPEQKIVIPPTGEELKSACTQISRLSSQVQTNLQVKTAIEKNWANFPAALERLKIAVQENWRCNLTGVLVKALKEGVPSENAAPPCAFFGWKEWADEAIKRRLMQYSHSQDGDIIVHFISGGQGLWSQLRSLSWSEVELVAKGEVI